LRDMPVLCWDRVRYIGDRVAAVAAETAEAADEALSRIEVDYETLPAVFDPNNPTFPGTRIDDLFSSGRPEFLMYGGNSADSELVGFAWYVKTTATTPPPGFAGNNDWWHRHPTLCFNNDMRVIANGPCTSNGTNVNLSEYWMSHAWIVEGWNTKSDVFMNHHPCLMPGGPAADGDPCWDVAESGGGH
ncbi:MAG: hypothetical protein IH940_08810, partial [Acidobacteria bacterium]|nr:hypothetical protein [Acidobacteriota bacterium]